MREPCTVTGLAETPTAIRTRRMRDRRRRGYQCVRVEVSDQDAAALVAAGLLDPARVKGKGKGGDSRRFEN